MMDFEQISQQREGTLLLVEADQHVTGPMAIVLEGFYGVRKTDLHEALEKPDKFRELLADINPSLVIYTVPFGSSCRDNFELAKRVRSYDPNQGRPILYVTSSLELARLASAHSVDGLKSGDIIENPYNFTEVIGQVEDKLNGILRFEPRRLVNSSNPHQLFTFLI